MGRLGLRLRPTLRLAKIVHHWDLPNLQVINRSCRKVRRGGAIGAPCAIPRPNVPDRGDVHMHQPIR